MTTRHYIIKDPQGLHARPAAQFVQAAAICPGAVHVTFHGKEVNGKSILSVLSLGVRTGDEITVAYETEDQAVVNQCESALKPLLS